MTANRRRDLGQQAKRVFEDQFLKLLAVESVELAERTLREISSGSPTRVLEIGSAGGVVSRLRPHWTTADVVQADEVEVLLPLDGGLPFEDNSFSMIFMQDTLHHLQDLDKFSSEAFRVLEPEGIIFCREPYWGPVSQVVFRFFHPEEFSLKKLVAHRRDSDPMSGNQALAWSLVSGKGFAGRAHPLKEFSPKFLKAANGLAFLLSGGATFTTSVDRTSLVKLHRWERSRPAWLRFFGVAAFLVFISNKPKKGPAT